MSLFITFEGGEGVGKSTQAKALAERLRKGKKWRNAIYAEEPGTTLLGRMLRVWVRGRGRSLTLIPEDETQLSLLEPRMGDHILPSIILRGVAPHAELLAFTIARAQLVEEVLLPNLKKNNIVICNRYADSTTAYQGYGRGLDLKLVELANNIATQGLKPDLTILLDLAPEEGLARKWGTNKKDLFEKQVLDFLDFHHRVREGYLKMAGDDPQRWLVVDATKSKDEIAQIIWQRVSQLLLKQGG